jgi:hypothetical protein
MTKPFAVHYTCANCGHQTTAETAFGRWMRNHPDLQPNGAFIVRTDTDHSILKFKTRPDGRDLQLTMDIEVKEFGAFPDRSQHDLLLIRHQLIHQGGRNLENALTHCTRNVFSMANRRRVDVRYLGLFLLQFERTCPDDSAWIKWNKRLVSAAKLVEILALEANPNDPHRPMDEFLRNRHALKYLPLFH